MKNQFGPKFYFVHDHLLKIVEGRPLTAEHSQWSSQCFPMQTKFGTFYGNRIQFALFNEIAGMVVCVYPNCENLFKTKKEADKKLKSIFVKINKHFDSRIASLEQDKKVIDREIRELKRSKREFGQD